jgi:uncharacterized SAM-binding protein YcdF (DUF218 family)
VKRKKYILRILLLVLPISVFVAIVINIDSFLGAAERFLVVEDQPEKSDIVFVPSGNVRYRFPKALLLLKAGLADKIVINLEMLSGEALAFQRQYGDRFSKRALIEHIVRVEGVDPSKIIIPPERSRSTREDFELLKDYIRREKVDSMIVVSSWYHLRRCQWVAKKVLSNDINAYFVPSILPRNNQYISKKKRIQALFNIYLKLAYYYVTT